MKSDLRSRKTPCHEPPTSIALSETVFLTLCASKNYRLDNHNFHEAMKVACCKANSWRVCCYVIMPDHLHMLLRPEVPAVKLAIWIRFWRRLISQELGSSREIWQRDYWDINLRQFHSETEVVSYILNNPVRKGLVKSAKDWPFSGKL